MTRTSRQTRAMQQQHDQGRHYLLRTAAEEHLVATLMAVDGAALLPGSKLHRIATSLTIRGVLHRSPDGVFTVRTEDATGGST